MKNCRRESWGNDSECYKSAFVYHKMKKKSFVSFSANMTNVGK